VLWAAASQSVTVRELRATVGGLSRERFEDAYYYLLANPPLGLIVQRHGEELRLVTAPRCHPPSNATSTCPVPSHCRRLPWRSWPIVGYRQ
jgi:hypothetical protein